jgi:hypothetical protein
MGHQVMRTLDVIGSDADPETLGVLRALAHRLPPSSFEKARESLANRTPPPDDRAAYVVGALNREVEEREAHFVGEEPA